MKGLTKTLVALALVMTLIATMGMSAMAANYSTKTVYQAEGKISVEANATGLEAGDIVTYVATTDASNVNEQTIVYINQAEVETGKTTATFNYTTAVTNINASMFFGGSKETTRQEAEHTGDYEIELKVGGTTVGTVYAAEQAENAGPVIRKFDLSGITSFSAVEITKVEFNGEEIEDFAVAATTLIVSTDKINGDGILAITTTTAPTFVAPKISDSTEVDVDGNLVAVAKAPAGEKFGIVVYTGDKPATLVHDYSNADGVIVLPALGKNVDGIYAVEVEDIEEFIGGKTFNVAAYAFNGDTAELSEAVKPITIAE